MQKRQMLYPYAALFFAVLFWGFSFIFTKIALESFSIFSLIFFRFGFSALFFILLMMKTGFPRLSRRDHWKFFAIALFQPWLYFLFETYGLSMTTASKASLIIATVPIMVLILSVLFLKEKAGISRLMGISLSITGVIILIGGDPAFKWQLDSVMLGDFLMFGAVLSAAVYTVMVRSLGSKFSAIHITGIQAIWGTILFLPEFLWELPQVDWSLPTSQGIAAVVALGLFATVGAFICYNYALGHLEAAKASVFINGVPVVTALGAWFILGESLSTLQLSGGAIILSGVYLANFRIYKARAKSRSKNKPQL
jgi:drug/metabolite transporter (DMT)-like permease